MSTNKRPIVVLDFGSQTGHLFARRVRDLGFASEVAPCTTPADHLRHCAGIVLSGGSASVYDAGSPQADPAIFDLGVPILGLCYGLHWTCVHFGGEVRRGEKQEYGPVLIEQTFAEDLLLRDCPDEWQVWMSHGDVATRLPEGFQVLARSQHCPHAAFASTERQIILLQWHPEHKNTEYGREIIRRFCQWCGASGWSVASHLPTLRQQIATEVGDRRVVALVSGGVDSTVMFTLLNEVVGPDRVHGILVDNGLLREGEVQEVRQTFAERGYRNFTVLDERERFLKGLVGVYEPEPKRRFIGNEFIRVAREEFERRGFSLDGRTKLAQGTIYPDTVETGPVKPKRGEDGEETGTIKTHHNRSELACEWIEAGLIIEPLKDFYKDEVRQLGRELGLPKEIVGRHPYPGPGMAVRVLCGQEPSWPATTPSLDYQCQPLPIRSVGAKGDIRSYEHALALYCSGDPYNFPEEFWRLAQEVPNTVSGYNRVVVCLSHIKSVEFCFTPGWVSPERLALVKQANQIVIEEVCAAGLYYDIWQFPVVLLPFGAKPGQQSIVLRPVESEDAMTATPYRLPAKLKESITRRLLAITGIGMVFYDLTTKPPGTIEFE